VIDRYGADSSPEVQAVVAQAKSRKAGLSRR